MTASATPPDPDAGLTDEEKKTKGLFKSWAKEAFSEFIAENAPEEEPPKRTEQKGGNVMSLLFGGTAKKD